jgi:predicted dienelactone hydrolase
VSATHEKRQGHKVFQTVSQSKHLRYRLPAQTVPAADMLRLAAVGLFFVSFLAIQCGAQEAVTVARTDGAQTALRVYRPAAGSGVPTCAPLAVFSPGLGGTENGYSYLGEGLRDSGWLTIVVGHK